MGRLSRKIATHCCALSHMSNKHPPLTHHEKEKEICDGTANEYELCLVNRIHDMTSFIVQIISQCLKQ